MGNSLFCEYESLINRSSIVERCPLTYSEIRTLLASFIPSYWETLRKLRGAIRLR